ncbi:alsin-like isoform X3 [Mytilus edulis]|uniref:alsin-like isoform X3 n=1 Tax=Mytilus edulis TaxID=6550 RepID=UPI0039EF87DB
MSRPVHFQNHRKVNPACHPKWPFFKIVTTEQGKKEEKDGCCFLWQGFYGSVDVVNFPIFKEKEVKQVALGGDHCLFLTKDGGVYACGQNNYGQLGIGNLETKETHDPVLVESLTDKEIDYIACGSNHSAAVTKYGDVFCWGVSSEGQCGVPEGSEKLHEGTVPLPQLIEIVKTCNEVCEHGNTGPHEKIAIQKIACGKNHTVALSVDNELWVWGSGIALGVNTVTKSVTPIQIEAFNGRNVLDIVCGEMYTMALVERSLLDISPRKRPSNIEKTTHKLFPSTCSKCNEEIYSYMETSDTCIITEDHVCKDTVKTSVSDQSQAIINLEELVDTSQSQQSLQTVISKENKITTEEGSTVTSGTSIENVTGDDKLLKVENPGSESKSKGDNTATQPNIQRSISDENVWQRQKPEIERSLSSKSDHRVSSSKSFLDGKNARQFLAKQLDDEDLALKFDSNGAVSDGSAAKGAVTDIWSTVQTGMQSAYAIPQQMTGMLSGFKTSLMDRMSASAPEEKEKEDTNSSMDSNIHLVGFDTSDEDVFHATQIVESQLGKDFRKSSTSKSPDPKTPKKSDCSFGETTFIEGIKTEMLFLDDSKTDELDQSKTVDPGEVTPKRGSQSAETTTKRSSMRTILAKQEELERKVSTRSSTTEDEMKRPSIIIDTEVWSWGKNSKGQLGVGDMGDRPNPTIVKALSNKRITKICCGTTHGMALTANSQVYSWGSNASGQLGRKEEAALPGLIKMVSGCFIWDIAAGSCFSIFLIDRAGFQPEVFFVGKHPTKDLYVPNHETNRLTSLNFLKQAGWIRSIVAGGDNSCCTSCYSFSGYFMTLFEVAATERKFYFYLHKVMKLLLDPLQKSAFYTSLDVYPYKSTLQNLMTAFQRIFTKICESMIEMTGMISKGEDLLQTSFFTNYSRYTVEYKRYYVALSDMLAVAGFEYICKTGSSFFDSDIVSKSLKELLPSDTRIERPNYHFLLIQILESPLTHMKEYSILAEKLSSHFQQDSEEFNMLHRVSLNWSSIRHMSTTDIDIAETTRAFWGGNSLQKLADAVKIPSRRLVKDSKKSPLVLQGGGRFSSHLFLLFNDMFIHVQGYNFQVFQLETAWIEAPTGGKLENMIVLTFPEDKMVLTASNAGERAEWLMTLNSAVNKVLSSQKTVGRRGSTERLTPPDIRQASFTFTKHPVYKDATYVGYWMNGKIHGLGEMKWSDGRRYNGNFKDGHLHGHGKLTIKQDDGSERSQEGYWKEGQLHGMGKVKYSNGDVYDGHFKEGQRHGHGLYHYGGPSPRSTSIYIGEWAEDNRQGYGVLEDIMKGEKYMGMWNEDKKHGKSIVVTLDGMYFEGNFDRDSLMGFGLMLTYDNSCYEGEFYGITQLQGKGKLIMPTGDSIEGIFSGSWNEGLKINGMFKKSDGQQETKKAKLKVQIPSSHYGKMSVPADKKWEGMFVQCRTVLGVKGQAKPNTNKAWEGVAVMVSKGRQVLHEMKTRNLSSKWKKFQGSFVEEIEKIPPHDKGMLTTEYYNDIKRYLDRAFEISFHPLGKLMDGLVDVFRAAYVGVGAHPRLLNHAVAEVNSYVKRIYLTVRILFPDLPQNGGPLQIRSEKYVDIDSDDETDGVIALQSTKSEKQVVSAGGLLHPILLPKIYPPLFDLYALHNDKVDEKYWERVQKLNKQGDVALMAYLGVDQKFWLLDESFFSKRSSSLSNIRDHCYVIAIERLQQISTAFSPKEKLQVIRDSFTEITETVQTTLGEEHIWCMDELFPIFQYVVVRSKIRHLGAEVHFIDDLMERYLENGELGIMFTTLYACYYQIQNEKIPTH